MASTLPTPQRARGVAFCVFAALALATPAITAVLLPSVWRFAVVGFGAMAVALVMSLAVFSLVRAPARKLVRHLEAENSDEVVVSVGLDGPTMEYLGVASQVVIRTARSGIEVWAEENPPRLQRVVSWNEIVAVDAGLDGVAVALEPVELYFSTTTTTYFRVLGRRHRRELHELVAAIELRRAIHSPVD